VENVIVDITWRWRSHMGNRYLLVIMEWMSWAHSDYCRKHE
jgi:hypothetical protein